MAREKELEEKQYQLYCSVYPHFSEKSFKTFEQFRSQKPKANTTKTREEIIEEAESIKHLHQSRKEE